MPFVFTHLKEFYVIKLISLSVELFMACFNFCVRTGRNQVCIEMHLGVKWFDVDGKCIYDQTQKCIGPEICYWHLYCYFCIKKYKLTRIDVSNFWILACVLQDLCSIQWILEIDNIYEKFFHFCSYLKLQKNWNVINLFIWFVWRRIIKIVQNV